MQNPGSQELVRRTGPLVEDIKQFLLSLGQNMALIRSISRGIERSGWRVVPGFEDDGRFLAQLTYEVRRGLEPRRLEYSTKATAMLYPRLVRKYGAKRVKVLEYPEGKVILVYVA